MTPVHSPIYGSTLHPHGTTREFLSMSRQLEVAIKFMVERTSRDRKVLVAYQLTGQQAKDMSVFSPISARRRSSSRRTRACAGWTIPSWWRACARRWTRWRRTRSYVASSRRFRAMRSS
ncbi:hypothetical protein ACFQX6_63485 [Streptosporangium lutulentum]